MDKSIETKTTIHQAALEALETIENVEKEKRELEKDINQKKAAYLKWIGTGKQEGRERYTNQRNKV